MRNPYPIELVHKVASCCTGDRYIRPTCDQPFRQSQNVPLTPAYYCLIDDEQNLWKHARQDTCL
jgi:hypothetical protein